MTHAKKKIQTPRGNAVILTVFLSEQSSLSKKSIIKEIILKQVVISCFCKKALSPQGNEMQYHNRICHI